MKIIIYILSFLLFSECNSQVEKESKDNAEEIISLIIDEFIKPLPLPPSIGLNDKELDSFKNTSKFKESINKKLRVAVYPVMEPVKDLKKDSVYSSDYNLLILKLNKLNTKPFVNIKNLHSKKRHQLFYADTLKLKAKDSYVRWEYEQKFDILFQISRVVFNNNFTKALTVIGVRRTRLDGFSALILLENKNGKWEIKQTKILDIS